MCLAGFTVPVIDDVANLPVDGSLLLAIYQPQYGLSPVSNANSTFSSGVQMTGAKQLLLIFTGIVTAGAIGGYLGITVWKNNTNGSGTPVAVEIPEGWRMVELLREQVNPSGNGSVYTEGWN